MGLQQFITELNALHQKARKGTLSQSEAVEYERDRDELAAALVNAQRVVLRPGQTPRQALRIGRVLPIELSSADSRQRAVTLEVSAGGFSINTSSIPQSWMSGVTFKLRLPDAQEVTGQAQLVSSVQAAGHTRVGFAIMKASDEDREALTRLVFDDVLSKLTAGKRV